MEKGMFFGFNLLLISILFVSSSFAQDSPQWHLPKGAKVRLGKGGIYDIAYSPDGKFLAVGLLSGFGYTMHTPGQNSIYSRGIRHRLRVWRSVQMAQRSQVEEGGVTNNTTMGRWDMETQSHPHGAYKPHHRSGVQSG